MATITYNISNCTKLSGATSATVNTYVTAKFFANVDFSFADITKCIDYSGTAKPTVTITTSEDEEEGYMTDNNPFMNLTLVFKVTASSAVITVNGLTCYSLSVTHTNCNYIISSGDYYYFDSYKGEFLVSGTSMTMTTTAYTVYNSTKITSITNATYTQSGLVYTVKGA